MKVYTAGRKNLTLPASLGPSQTGEGFCGTSSGLNFVKKKAARRPRRLSLFDPMEGLRRLGGAFDQGVVLVGAVDLGAGDFDPAGLQRFGEFAL